MHLRTLGSALTLGLGMAADVAFASNASPAAAQKIQLQQIRNATVKVTFAETTFLVDPMLSKKGTYPGFPLTYRSSLRNPLVDLPMPENDVINGADAVIVTHTHLDHWDDAAQKLLPKNIPLFVQNQADAETIQNQGFTDVRILTDQIEFGGVTLSKTGGQHGTDEMYSSSAVAKSLGEAMGVVFEAPGHETLYLVGDTIWRDEVDQALARYTPGIIVINAGYAAMSDYDGSIIMGKEDVLRAARVAAEAKIVAIHMDAINHMFQSRKELREYVKEQGIQDRVEIPEDGALLEF